MATPENILRLMKAVSKRLFNTLNDPAILSKGTNLNAQFNKALADLNRITALSFKYLSESDLQGVFRESYNDLGNKLFKGQSQLDFSTLPKNNINSNVKLVEREVQQVISEMGKMATFNINERKRMQSEMKDALNYGLERRAILGKKASAAGINIPRSELDKLTDDIAKRFSPTTGVRKFRNEYFGIEKGADKLVFDKIWSKSWDKTSNTLLNTIQSGIRTNKTQQQISKDLLTKLDKVFPFENQKGAKEPYFPVAVKGKDGKISMRRLGMRYYTELKTGDQVVRTESAGTVSAMLDAGFDTVVYRLGSGAEEHTDLCLKLSGNGKGKRYSISGKSATYPQLEIYPPAHYGCFSRVDPVPSAEQERFEVTDDQKEDVGETITKDPREDAKQFEKDGGTEKPISKKKSETQELKVK